MKTSTFRWAAVAATIVAAGAVVLACGDDDTVAPPNTPLDGGGDASSRADTGTADGGDTPVDGGGTDASDADDGRIAVTINFKAKVGSADFKCGTAYEDLGTTNARMEPADLRFFVSNVALVSADGTEVPVTIDVRAPWQTGEVAMLDFEDATGRCSNGNTQMNAQVTGRVAPGTYTGVAFTNGIPLAANHSDPATAPPPLSAGGMTWGWLSGHLFIKAEMAAYADAGDDAGPGYGLFHLGSTGCTNVDDGGVSDPKAPATECKAPNRNRVKLTGFDAATQAIVFDVKELFSDTDVSVSSRCHSMMNASCGPLFKNVGLDYTDAGGVMSAAPVFRVE